MDSSEETKDEEQLCLQCGVVVSAQAEHVGIEQVSSIRLCASCLEDAPESVKGGEAALLDLEEIPSQISSSASGREASVSLRAPPPPRRVSQAAPQIPVVQQETPSLQLAPEKEAKVEKLEAVYQPLDQGSLMPVSWEDDSGILRIKTPVITRSVPPPLPPRPSRRPRSNPSSDQLLREMGGVAHSLPIQPVPVIHLAASGEGAPVRKRRKKAFFLSASIVAAFGMTAGLTYFIATNVPMASQGQGDLTPAASPLPTPVTSNHVSEPTPGPALPVVKAAEVVETAKKTPGPLKEKPRTPRKPPSKKSPSNTRAQSTAVVAAPAAPSAPPVEEAIEEQPIVRKFDIRALKSGVSDVMASIGSCRSAADPSGIAKVVMVFSTSGRVTSATVSGPPFAGTTTGGCIAGRFRSLRLPAFDGERRTIRKTVVVQ